MTDTRSGLDAWTVPMLAAALDVNALEAELVLENSVTSGNAVRLTQAGYTFYVPGSLQSALTSMGVAIVEGERLEKRRREVRERLARIRAQRLRNDTGKGQR